MEGRAYVPLHATMDSEGVTSCVALKVTAPGKTRNIRILQRVSYVENYCTLPYLIPARVLLVWRVKEGNGE